MTCGAGWNTRSATTCSRFPWPISATASREWHGRRISKRRPEASPSPDSLMPGIYLDYNATAPLRPQAMQRMQELLAGPCNPSSVHRYGREARKWLEQARKTLADTVSAWPGEVVFTASGTEANATALRGFPARRVLASAIEHSSVLKCGTVNGQVAVARDG